MPPGIDDSSSQELFVNDHPTENPPHGGGMPPTTADPSHSFVIQHLLIVRSDSPSERSITTRSRTSGCRAGGLPSRTPSARLTGNAACVRSLIRSRSNAANVARMLATIRPCEVERSKPSPGIQAPSLSPSRLDQRRKIEQRPRQPIELRDDQTVGFAFDARLEAPVSKAGSPTSRRPTHHVTFEAVKFPCTGTRTDRFDRVPLGGRPAPDPPCSCVDTRT